VERGPAAGRSADEPVPLRSISLPSPHPEAAPVSAPPQARQSKIAAMLARRRLQPLWRALFKISLRGLGYHNYDPSLNGEERFWRRWAAAWRADAGYRSGSALYIFDVGANEGDFTASLLALVPPETRFFLFEPAPKTAARLKQRFANRPEIIVEAVGVGARANTLPLYDVAKSEGTPRASFLPQAIIELVGVEAQTSVVPVVALDDFCRERNIVQIDYLKIDTEGFERMVLEGARRLLAERRIRTIQIEMNEHHVFTGFSVYELHQRLPGFDILRMMPYGLEPLVGAGRPYSPRYDIPRYCNLVCEAPRFAASHP
jgi:FkbM family methyltransferase